MVMLKEAKSQGGLQVFSKRFCLNSRFEAKWDYEKGTVSVTIEGKQQTGERKQEGTQQNGEKSSATEPEKDPNDRD